MESDTGTKKSNRWLRASSSNRGEIEQLLDLYWGGKERRITGLTIRIIGVNIIAVLALVFGVIYLGKYHSTLINAKLERFETEIVLVTIAIIEGAVEKDPQSGDFVLSEEKAKILSARIGATIDKRILVFDNEKIVADSKFIIEEEQIEPVFEISKLEQKRLNSVEMLKNTASWIASIFPKSSKLPLFLGINSQNPNDYYDVVDAKSKKLSMSAWYDKNGEIILTAAMPILKDKSNIVGAVMLVGHADDIKEALGDTWFRIINIFLVTLLITILISIYLSGVIARPLRKLATAAENVRKGKLSHNEIPDMSHRNDEIGELSVVLRDMTHALCDRMDMIEAFAADVSHEIKNPLTSLKSAVETAVIVKKKKDLNKLLDIIRHDVDRLDRLITDISNASRLDAELSRETFEKVDIKQLLRQLLDFYKTPLERKISNDENKDMVVKDNVTISLDLPEEDAFTLGSKGRLMQVFQNIISNALSFSPKGSEIKIILERNNNRIIVTIEDEGCGIPENNLNDIFERFYSQRPDHEEYGQHSGLGLSICKQIITAHNGMIYAENKDKGETGARFVVILNAV